MKKTVDINLGGTAFIIDEDAFLTLKNYLNDVASRLPETDPEIIGDVESRIAEIFQNHISIRSQVVDLNLVQKTISIMGRPEEFGEKKHIDEMKENIRSEHASRRLIRNMNDKMIGGVCSGIAAYFGIDTTIIRVITLLLIFFGGLSLWVYIILWIVIPKGYIGSGNTDKSGNSL